MENVIVLLLLLSPGVPCRPLPLGSDEQDLGRKTRGGISPRGNGVGVSTLIGDGCACSRVPRRRGKRAYVRCLVGFTKNVFTRHKTNWLHFRPFSTKLRPEYAKFRDATREATPEAAAPQIRLVSVFFH